MHIEMVPISSAYRKIPKIEQLPAEDLSLDLLNKKVEEVTRAINQETDEILKDTSEISENSNFLEEVKKAESSLTNRIVEWLATHVVFAFVLLHFKFFKAANAELKELKSKEAEYQSKIDRTEKDKKMFEASLSKHSQYKDDLEAEKARKEANLRLQENLTFANRSICDLFEDGEREFNRLHTLKVANLKDIKLKDVTHPIMRFDDGFIITNGVVIVNEFGELPQIQVFYAERDKDRKLTGNWKSWSPPNMVPLIKINGNWIENGQRKEGFVQIREFISKVKDREKLEKEYDFDERL